MSLTKTYCLVMEFEKNSMMLSYHSCYRHLGFSLGVYIVEGFLLRSFITRMFYITDVPAPSEH